MKKLIVILCAALFVVVVGAMSINAAQKGYEWKNRPGYTSAYVDTNGDGICDHAAYKNLTCHECNAGYTSAYIDVNGDGRCDHWTDNDHCYEYHANHHQHGYHHGR